MSAMSHFGDIRATSLFGDSYIPQYEVFATALHTDLSAPQVKSGAVIHKINQ
jgi:hypothetical protein